MTNLYLISYSMVRHSETWFDFINMIEFDGDRNVNLIDLPNDSLLCCLDDDDVKWFTSEYTQLLARGSIIFTPLVTNKEDRLNAMYALEWFVEDVRDEQ